MIFIFQESYGNVLEILLRMRQICVHRSLIGNRKVLTEHQVKQMIETTGKHLNPEEKERLMNILKSKLIEECSVW